MSVARDDPHVYFESQGGWPESWGPPPSMVDLERWTTTVEEPTQEDWDEYARWAERTDGAPTEEEPEGRMFVDEDMPF